MKYIIWNMIHMSIIPCILYYDRVWILVYESVILFLVMLFKDILYIYTQKAKMYQIEGFIRPFSFKFTVFPSVY